MFTNMFGLDYTPAITAQGKIKNTTYYTDLFFKLVPFKIVFKLVPPMRFLQTRSSNSSSNSSFQTRATYAVRHFKLVPPMRLTSINNY